MPPNQPQYNALDLAEEVNAFRARIAARNPELLGTIEEIDLTTNVSAPIAAESMTEVRKLSLHKAHHLLMQEREANKRSQTSNVGSKERQYIDMMRDDRKLGLTTNEILYSEIPICVEDIPTDKLREIVAVSRHRQIRGDGIHTRIEFICGVTGIIIPWAFAYFYDGNIYAVDHLPQTHICRFCQNMKICTLIPLFDGNEIMACRHCILDRRNCSMCGDTIHPKYAEVRLCSEHVETPDDRESRRTFAKGIKWVSKGKGDIIKSTRIFSCEIEALSPQANWENALASGLPSEAGIAHDGSVIGKGLMGFEIQTPKLGGITGEEFVKRSSGILKLVRAVVNETCGMHIHLDGKGILLANRRQYPAALIQLFKTYLVFEDVLLSFLPHMRRHNDYCRPLSDTFKLSEIESFDHISQIEKVWYRERTYGNIAQAKQQHYHASRYFGTNFNSLLKDGHLEIRFHSATTNAKKILEWANLHMLIMDACQDLQFDPRILQEAMLVSRLTEKTNILFNVIGLSEKSKQYFRSRQHKFGDKNNNDEEILMQGPQQPRESYGRLFQYNYPPVHNMVPNVMVDFGLTDQPIPNFIDSNETEGL